MELPNNWQPRLYQFPLWDYLQKGGRRAIEIAHRRWGKDDVILHHTACAAAQRIGNYWHCLPEYEQARKAIWNAVNPHTGFRRIDEAFPQEIRKRTDQQGMLIELFNGSTWQLIGSDRYDATVGSTPVGIAYSEWALSNPSAWAYHRPMLVENDGWAAFITTPRGNNHAKSMYELGRDREEWFAEVSTVLDTKALTQEQLDEALAEYQALYGGDFGTAMFEQEYLCSFSGAMVGAIFGGEINRAERDGRITRVDVDHSHPVYTAWDLGKAVNNPIWCFQCIPNDPQIKIVDFYRPENDDLEEWVRWLDDRGYTGTDWVPHDAMATEWGTGRTRVETLRSLGRRPRRIPKVSVQDGINAGNQTIRAAVFDAERCELGIEGLRNYRREWDDELKTFRENPVKDWAEHIGSAWRYLGLSWREIRKEEKREPEPVHHYIGQADGTIKSGLTVAEIIKRNSRRRQGSGRLL